MRQSIQKLKKYFKKYLICKLVVNYIKTKDSAIKFFILITKFMIAYQF